VTGGAFGADLKTRALLCRIGNSNGQIVDDACAIALRNAEQFDTTGAIVEEMAKAAVLPQSNRAAGIPR
jgi:hypothetical protein